MHLRRLRRVGDELGGQARHEQDRSDKDDIWPLHFRQLVGNDGSKTRLDRPLPDHVRTAETQQQVEIEAGPDGRPVQ